MRASATVREWHEQDGWGVLDSDEAPGGAWVHFSAISGAGYQSLTRGERVDAVMVRADQDGYRYRAELVVRTSR